MHAIAVFQFIDETILCNINVIRIALLDLFTSLLNEKQNKTKTNNQTNKKHAT